MGDTVRPVRVLVPFVPSTILRIGDAAPSLPESGHLAASTPLCLHTCINLLVELIIAYAQSPYIEMYNDSTRRLTMEQSHYGAATTWPYIHPHRCRLHFVPWTILSGM
jgi:hypothetical protein